MGDIRTTTGEATPLTKQETRKRGLFYTLVTILVLFLLFLAGSAIKVPRHAFASGYVTTEDYAEVRPAVTGTVAQILVKTGETVEAGQLLVQLNAEEEEATLAETKARQSKLMTELERRKAEMDIDLERRSVEIQEQKQDQEQKLQIAELQLKNATAKRMLTENLVKQGLKAAMNLEDEKLQEELAKVTLLSLQQKDFKIYEELLKRDREKYNREISAIEDELSALADAVRRAEARLRIRQIRAPIAGTVVRYEFVVGELLQPTSVIYEIFGGTNYVLKLRVPERYATKVQQGQPYRARINTNHSFTQDYFRGEVLALRNVIQGESSNTWRTAYCSFDPGDNDVPPGTTATAEILYGRSSLWLYLFNIDM